MSANAIAEALRLTSKGRLHYDRHGWNHMKEELEDLNRSFNSIAFFPAYWRSPDYKDDASDEPYVTKDECDNEKSVSADEDSSDSEEIAAHDESMAAYERERQMRSKKIVAEKFAHFENHVQLGVQQAELKYKFYREQQLISHQKQREKQLAQLIARSEKLKQLKHSQKEKLDYNIQQTKAKIKEAEITQKQIDAEIHEKRQQQERRATTIHKYQKAITDKYEIIAQVLRTCANVEQLPETLKEEGQKQKMVALALEKLIGAAKSGTITENDLKLAEELVQTVDAYLMQVVKAVELRNKMTIEAIKGAQDSSIILSTESGKETENDVPVTSDYSPSHVEQNKFLSPASEGEKQTFVNNTNALKDYVQLQMDLQAYEESYQQLKEDASPSLKEYKLLFQNAFSMPVNTISVGSGSQLKAKLERLEKVLSGESVKVRGIMVSPLDHPQGMYMCKDQLAKKFVSKGEKEIASNIEIAFPIAAIIIALWVKFPDFGQLFLANLQKECPYIVPYYISPMEGQTEEEYDRAIGYKFPNGKKETKNEFLKRMNGFIRLYAAVMCTPVPSGTNKAHPHGIENGWRWLARILNLDPRPDITAKILNGFLETAGFSMHRAYGDQFKKLLQALFKDYFVKMKQVTTGGSGSLVELKVFFEKCGFNIPPPKGAELLSGNRIWTDTFFSHSENRINY